MNARVVHQDRLRLLVQLDLLGLIGLAGACLSRRRSPCCSTGSSLLPPPHRNRPKLVVRVRVVGTPAVTGDHVLAGRALLEEDAEVAADLIGLETERLSPGLGQERDARGSWPARS
jgi:hypothetical protein